MAQNFGDNPTYLTEFNNDLNKCFSKFDDDITKKSNDHAWKGMYEYWLSDGSNHDSRNMTDHWAPNMNNWWREAQQHKEKMFGTWRGDAYLIT